MAEEKGISMAREENEKGGSDAAFYSHDVPLDALPKSRWERSWPTIACGAGLFSDGYIQGLAILSEKKKARNLTSSESLVLHSSNYRESTRPNIRRPMPHQILALLHSSELW